MALLSESDVRYSARQMLAKSMRTADALLRADSEKSGRFDIFLSHSIVDAEVVFGVSRILEARGKSVYVDWVQDRDLNRDNVTPATARRLRRRLEQSESLFYLHTRSSSSSRWMPWELGYFDAHNGNVAILPVVRESSGGFKGEEFLGLYPYVDVTDGTIWINGPSGYKSFDDWHRGSDKLRSF